MAVRKTRQQAKKTAAVEDEDEGLNPNQYHEKRLSYLAAQKAAGIDPYPHEFEAELSIPEYVKRYNKLRSGDQVKDVEEKIAGRLTSKQSSSSKLFLYELHGDGAKVQVMADARNSDFDEEEFTQFHSSVKRGDIVGLIGFPGKSKKDELIIFPKTFTVLSHCLHLIPQQKVGLENVKNTHVWSPGLPRNPETYILKDQETRYRQRYLDLMLNAEVREIFKTRSKVVSSIRHFLDEQDFLEVETPMINMTACGAAARPFITHNNEQNMRLNMRVSSDIYLKELVVGGLNRVYEIGKKFTNERINISPNPEFTTCEFYMAFADYNDLMKLTEDMLSGMVKEIAGGYKIKYHSNGLDNDPIEIDFTPPFRRIDMIDELEKMAHLSIPKDLSSARANKYLIDACMKFDIQCHPPRTSVRLLDELVKHFLEETCTNPTFIINYPKIVHFMAKEHRSKPGLTETFELFINKFNVCTVFTELNDPVLQRQCFADLQGKQLGDDEAMALDETFCTALEYGLPPTAGCVLGIDKFTMLLTDSQDIKEVVLFSAMKPQDEPSSEERMSQSSHSRAPTPLEPETADTAKELASSIIKIVQQFTAEQNAQARAAEVVPRFLKYQPRKFKGREGPEAAEEWLQELDRIFNHIAYTDKERVSCAAFQLVEDAYYWWESHTKTMTPEHQAELTWEQFKQIVTKKYIPKSYFHDKEAEFNLLNQGSMTVTEYERLFHRLSRYAPYLVDTDVKSAERFKQGLRPDICCLLPESITFDEMVERAQKIERAAREHDKGKRKWGNGGSSSYRARNQRQRAT